MNILFLCYWSIEEGLTSSTVIPHLNILNEIDAIDKILFFTIEREMRTREVALPPKTVHVPLASGKKYLYKILDFIRFPGIIGKTISTYHISFMFCKGAPAGALGYLVHRKTGIGYAVESMEPHAEYMVESGIWFRWGLRYKLQRYWESKQLRSARFLLPLTDRMKSDLTAKGVSPAAMLVMPCGVDHEKFSFNEQKRDAVRTSLEIPPDCITGIYLGKFGGLYYDEEAFHIFKYSLEFFPKFKLIILTPDHATQVESKLLQVGFQKHDYHIMKVDHNEVPPYLSAADFAFALIKPSPSKMFSSPIKVGEYWSIGLPVLITEGIGDDSEIIQDNKAGATLKFPELELPFTKIQEILSGDRLALRKKIRELALRYRNLEVNRDIYRRIIYEIGV